MCFCIGPVQSGAFNWNSGRIALRTIHLTFPVASNLRPHKSNAETELGAMPSVYKMASRTNRHPDFASFGFRIPHIALRFESIDHCSIILRLEMLMVDFRWHLSLLCALI